MSKNVLIKWDNFNTAVIKSFDSLRKEEDFCDVTLVSDDEVHISAHKVVLSSCSPFFKNILKKTKHSSNPLIFLHDMKSEDLQHVMDYIYQGQVMVPQQQFDEFMKLSKKLQLDGFSTDTSSPGDFSFDDFDPKQDAEVDPTLFELPSESTLEILYPTQTQDFESSRTMELDPLTFEMIKNNSGTRSRSRPLQQTNFKKMELQQEQVKPKSPPVASDPAIFSIKDMDLVEKKLTEFSQKVNGGYLCKICGKLAPNRTNHLMHIETHMDGLFFQCDRCDRTTKTRNAMRKHFDKFHNSQ